MGVSTQHRPSRDAGVATVNLSTMRPGLHAKNPHPRTEALDNVFRFRAAVSASKVAVNAFLAVSPSSYLRSKSLPSIWQTTDFQYWPQIPPYSELTI